MKKVLALSCCCVDFFPEKNSINVGGNALNVAVSCVKTGKVDVSLMGNIGTDEYAEKIIETVDKYKINRQKLYMADGITANNKIYLTDEGEKYEKDDSWTNGVYAEFEGVYDFKANLIEGELPTKQRKLVEAWTLLHEDELNAAWIAWSESGEVIKIEGLR